MGFELTTLVVIGTDCIGSCKFNYHTIAVGKCKDIFVLFVVIHPTSLTLRGSLHTLDFMSILKIVLLDCWLKSSEHPHPLVRTAVY